MNKYDRLGGFWFSLAYLLVLLSVSAVVGLGVTVVLNPYFPLSTELLLQISTVAAFGLLALLDVLVWGER